MIRRQLLATSAKILLSTTLCIVMLSAAHAADQQKILVLGDSLSAGYGLATGEGWVTLLTQKIAQEKLPWQVVNASISGEVTAGGLARINKLLAEHYPSIVVVELGANDGLRGQSTDAMTNNLSNIIERSQKNHALTLLIGMRLPPNLGPKYATKFNQAYTTVAAKTHSAFTPFLLEGFANKSSLFQADGLHPVAAAQPMMLNNVWVGLLPLLKRRS